MRQTMRFVLSSVLLAMPGIAAAAEATQKGTMQQRRLLQPPKMSIPSPITDRLAVRGVFYMPSIDTDLRYDNSAGVPGTLLSGEDTLLFKDQLQQGSADLTFRIIDRHRIRAEFYRMTRSGDQFLTQGIRFGDDIYNVNDRLLSSMDLRKLDMVYTYSFLRRERVELSAGIALHLLQAEGELDVPARFVRERLDVAGPFATLAFDGTWRISRRFSLNARANYLSGDVDDVSGSYKQYHGDVQFRARPNLALGAGYTMTRIHMDSADPSLAGLFDFRFQGPEAFLRVSF